MRPTALATALTRATALIRTLATALIRIRTLAAALIRTLATALIRIHPQVPTPPPAEHAKHRRLLDDAHVAPARELQPAGDREPCVRRFRMTRSAGWDAPPRALSRARSPDTAAITGLLSRRRDRP